MHDMQGVMCNAASFRQCASRDTKRHRLDKGIDVRNPAHVQAYVVAREKTPRVRAGRVLITRRLGFWFLPALPLELYSGIA